MKPGGPALRVLVMVGCLLAGLLAWQLVQPGFRREEVRLPDGTVLGLVSVQYGKLPLDPFLTPRERWVSLLPATWAKWLRLRQPSNPNPTPGQAVLSVWLSSTAPLLQGNGADLFGVRITDDEGQSGVSSDFAPPTFLVPDDKKGPVRRYQGHLISIFPRRAPYLRVQVFSQFTGTGNPEQWLHEFRVRNPAGVSREIPFATSPETSKASRSNVSVTLKEVQLIPSSDAGFANGPTPWFVSLKFLVKENGSESTNWMATHLQHVSDATGNTLQAAAGRVPFRTPETDTRDLFIWRFPESEPCRMSVEFARISGFSSNDIYHFPKVPISRGGRAILSIPPTVPKPEFLLQWLGPPGGHLDEDGNLEPVLNVIVRPPKDGDGKPCYLTLVKAVDSDGVALTEVRPLYHDDHQFIFSVRARTNAVAADLWIAATPMEVFHFVAQPGIQSRSAIGPKPNP